VRVKRMKGEGENQRATERGLRARSNGENENLLTFYVSNYMKDSITQPTDRQTDQTYLPFLPVPNQPTNSYPPLSAIDRIPFSLRYSSLRLCLPCSRVTFPVSPHIHAGTRMTKSEKRARKEKKEERILFMFSLYMKCVRLRI